MFRKTLAAIAFTTFTIGSAQALTIDTFNTDQVVTDGLGGGATVSTVSDAANILGTDRTVTVDQQGPGATAASININTGTPGLLTMGNTDAFSTSTVLYGGAGGLGLGGVDVTEGGTDDRFNLFMVSGDFPTLVTMIVTDTSANIASLTIPTPGLGSNVPLLFEYTAFAGGPVDFMLIDFIQIALDTTDPQADLRLDFFATTSEIPEPATLAILGLGLTGLGFIRRRRA